MGPVKLAGSGSNHDERQEVAWTRSLALTEPIALEAARIQDTLTDQGNQMPARDVRIAATASSTGDELIVADEGFAVVRLRPDLDVVQLAP